MMDQQIIYIAIILTRKCCTCEPLSILLLKVDVPSPHVQYSAVDKNENWVVQITQSFENCICHTDDMKVKKFPFGRIKEEEKMCLSDMHLFSNWWL